MNRKAISEYCEFGYLDVNPPIFSHPLDSNDMTAAMNKMVEKVDWEKFFWFVYEDCGHSQPPIFVHRIMQPSRFFELLSEAIEKGVIGK